MCKFYEVDAEWLAECEAMEARFPGLALRGRDRGGRRPLLRVWAVLPVPLLRGRLPRQDRYLLLCSGA